MLELATIVREAGDEYRQRFSDRMLPSHLRALRDILHCRTAVLGGQLYRCEGCAREQYGYHSCQNRACPKCQSERTQAWLQAQHQRLLPCEHFLFTFTLPAPLRPIARANQKLVYDALLRCAADAVTTLAANPRHLGARPAILAVLHTHGRDLGYHPHAHLLVSAGGLDPSTERFVASKYPRFLLPGRVLSVLFRQKLRDALEREGLTQNLPASLWTSRWVVHAQSAGDGERVLDYLGRYLFKNPLPNSRLERFEGGKVTFRFQSHRTGKIVHQTLPTLVFLQRLLQHVLPARLHHVRGYGLLAPTCKSQLDRAHQLLQPCTTDAQRAPPEMPPAAAARTCPFCSAGRMLVVAHLSPAQALALASRFPLPRSPP